MHLEQFRQNDQRFSGFFPRILQGEPHRLLRANQLNSGKVGLVTGRIGQFGDDIGINQNTHD